MLYPCAKLNIEEMQQHPYYLKLSVSSGSHPDNENANYQILNKPTAW
jgi:hypothetical protein